MVSSPSNRTTFAALAVGDLPDVHLIDPAGRVLVRKRGTDKAAS